MYALWFELGAHDGRSLARRKVSISIVWRCTFSLFSCSDSQLLLAHESQCAFPYHFQNVNTAARMESNGEKNKIQVSQKTAELIKLAGKG
jgi:Adenylate and Guanylate cyclase catalytic domain